MAFQYVPSQRKQANGLQGLQGLIKTTAEGGAHLGPEQLANLVKELGSSLGDMFSGDNTSESKSMGDIASLAAAEAGQQNTGGGPAALALSSGSGGANIWQTLLNILSSMGG